MLDIAKTTKLVDQCWSDEIPSLQSALPRSASPTGRAAPAPASFPPVRRGRR